MTPLSKLRKINALIVSLVCVFIFASCINEDNQLGLDLVKTSGGMDILQAPDGIVRLNSAVFKTDSLETAQNDNFILGSYKDSQFGEIRTSIYTSLGLEDNSGFDFANIGEIDSAVLCLAYSQLGAFRKDTAIKTDNMTISVSMLKEEIDSTKKYAFDNIPTDIEIFSGVVLSDPLHGVVLQGDTSERVPHLRMTLKSDFVDKLQKGTYENQSDFTNDFKGIKISAKSSNDSYLAGINMKSDNSGIFVYYHDNAGNRGTYMINFTQNGRRFMHVDRNYTGSSLASLGNASANDTLKTQTYIYLATMGVAEATINLMDLEKWYSQDSVKGVALNRAELILPVADINTATYLFPKRINTFRKQGDKYYYLDDELAGKNWLGNTYDASINAYRLDVTSYLQSYLKGTYEDCIIYLVPDGRISSGARVVLNGMESSNPPKLNIIYSHPATD